MATDLARLGLIRTEVAAALAQFLARQRTILAAISEDMLAWTEAIDGLLAGGKRLRPAFCYWGWRAAGGPDCAEIYTTAACLELLQASALIHDDVMDASDTRRGRPAVHRQFAARHAAAGHPGSADQFGAGAAILIGDALLAWTDELYHESGFGPDVQRRGQPALDAMRTEVAAGQYLDLVSQFSQDASVAAALRVITYKTAKYTIERPLQLGAALAGGSDAVAGICSGYGIPLGIAFQLRDDILGVFGDPARTGKPVTGDISEGKRTVLVALARERADDSQEQLLARCLGDRSLTEAGAEQVRAVIAETGALAECEALIATSVKEAISALDGAPVTAEARDALADLAIMATERNE
jgi:geranylgeranyl diphosphate synthase type I